MKDAKLILKQYNLRQTQLRMDILNQFIDRTEALSHRDIGDCLEELDRITLYRNLKTFEEQGVLHKIHSGSVIKYALCHDECTEQKHLDNHVHFKCRKCSQIHCIDHVSIPTIKLPYDYQLEEVTVVISGLCRACK